MPARSRFSAAPSAPDPISRPIEGRIVVLAQRSAAVLFPSYGSAMIPDSGSKGLPTEPDEVRVCLKIADIDISIASAARSLTLALDTELYPFRTQSLAPDLCVEAAWGDLDKASEEELIFDSGGSWRLYRDGDSYLFRCYSPALGEAPYKLARINSDFNSGVVQLHSRYFDMTRAVYPLQYPLDELLMLHLLSRGRGIEVHACGVMYGSGDGLLFPGHSGAGKTTMARLWEKTGEITILSDDRIIVRRVDGEYWMYGTPWHGEDRFAQPVRARLRQVYFLRQGSENALSRKTGAEAAARLFSCIFPTFYDPDGLQYTLDFCDGLTQAVSCHEVSVVPDHRVVDMLRRHAG